MDNLDRGQVENETEEMRKTREEILAKSPPPKFFKMRAQMLKQGRSDKQVAKSDLLSARVKVYASGGENGLHNHSGEDHMHIVLQGSACFYGPRGEESHIKQYEGIMLPKGAFYRFHCTSQEPLVLLRLAARRHDGKPGRANIYGDTLNADSEENGKGQVIPIDGMWWGAKE
jgi:mannose-6-phosphate isomerase-like protein (cupin superfamily)